MSGGVLVAKPADGICQISINRPERRNALDVATYARLGEVLLAADQDDAIRVIVLSGEGKHFTAGNDLSDFRLLKGAESVPGIDFLRILAGVSKPVIAAIEGYAIGIGTTMLLHCDLAYGGKGSTFRLPFVGLGLCPEGGATYLLPLLSGSKVASNLLFFGEPFLADLAREIGLINEVVEEGRALEVAIKRGEALAQLPSRALSKTKALLASHRRSTLNAAMAAEEREFLDCCASDEAQAAFEAFLNK
ncbi:enoyl-CoA hydratase-related protein [Metapseudomonas resinovorans]|uniref:Putative enoyl-CoA hydratase n=1 Tax=Metapseudomonas resinovorans NBRC 106553 TaxID=1245471 RepID=S6ARP0_METRE|nr:enoyl-CoA hydratase-related protein [Pseudomonas resinovorans]BAN48593.1 putative enoyl-CoA hydratase [Pseudomonas resinovorans NBRC 106553]